MNTLNAQVDHNNTVKNDLNGYPRSILSGPMGVLPDDYAAVETEEAREERAQAYFDVLFYDFHNAKNDL